MYYIKFISEDGIEKNITGFEYVIQPRKGWDFVTVFTRDPNGLFESNYCVGNVPQEIKDHETFFCSMFVMNINGQTIDKIVSK